MLARAHNQDEALFPHLLVCESSTFSISHCPNRALILRRAADMDVSSASDIQQEQTRPVIEAVFDDKAESLRASLETTGADIWHIGREYSAGLHEFYQDESDALRADMEHEERQERYEKLECDWTQTNRGSHVDFETNERLPLQEGTFFHCLYGTRLTYTQAVILAEVPWVMCTRQRSWATV